MSVCRVEGCNSIKDENIAYFEFPLSRTLRRKWLDVLKVGAKVPLGTLVCSHHFSANDYETVRGKVRLKRKVVPTVRLKTTSSQPQPSKTLGEPKQKSSAPKDDSAEVEIELPPIDMLLNNDADVDDLASLELHDNSKQTVRKSPVPDLIAGSEVDSQKDRVIDKEQFTKSLNLNPSGDKKEGVRDRRGKTVKDVAKDLASVAQKDPQLPDPKQPPDFEEMITNYQIKKKKRALLAKDTEVQAAGPCEREGACERDSAIVVDDRGDAPPVFIEISVDKDQNTSNSNSRDCLMVLESVQVDIDPNTLMLPERPGLEPDDADSDVEITEPDKKVDPISLLTSSDEDDVILQEPKIDTVEVSDETDEDDRPLVKLVKSKRKTRTLKRRSKLVPMTGQDLRNIVWSGDYGLYCVHCRFSTTDSVAYTEHLESHKRPLYVCSSCSYTTSSKTQFARHLRKHKEEKKFKCHLCSYSARHNMSLIYHLQAHDQPGGVRPRSRAGDDLDTVKRGFKCIKCHYRSDFKGDVVKHLKLCNTGRKFTCDICKYSSKRKSDLRRHWSSVHRGVFVALDSDVGYKPAWE